MKEVPKLNVSVCIPSYNAEKYIQHTILSVFSQTVLPRELIVYDDGSTDKTIDILNHISQKLPIRIIEATKNKGVGFARKRLVEEATMKYMCFLSADDMMERNYIEEMMKEAKKTPNTILYCDYNVINEDGKWVREVKERVIPQYEDWIIANILKARSNTMSVNYNLFSPTKLLKENNFDGSLRLGEDLEHLLRCTLLKKVKFRNIGKILLNYRMHATSTTNTKIADIAENNKKIFKRINKILGEDIL